MHKYGRIPEAKQSRKLKHMLQLIEDGKDASTPLPPKEVLKSNKYKADID